RDGHDGYVRRFELVLLSLLRCEEFERAVRFEEDRLLVSDRSVHWRRGTRDSAPDLFALLDEDDARYRAHHVRRGGEEAFHTGNGDSQRPEDVEVGRECGAGG